MKLTKSLFLLCAAGLSLCACNSDDIKNQLPEGYGAVEVRIVNPLTRSVVDPTDANKTVGDGIVTVTLYCGDPLSKHSSVEINTATESVAKFWDVVDPKLVTASIHGGLAPSTSAALEGKGTYGNIETYQMLPDEEVPAYGETSVFTLTANSEVHNSKTYQMYSAGIIMQVPFARLEFTVKRSDAASDFTTLDLGGVYLDNLYKSGSADETTDTKHPDDDNFSGFNTTATGEDATLFDVASAGFSFTGANVIAPSATEVYAYNIFPADGLANLPKLKVWFKNATDDPSVLPYQYAIINSYSVTKFEAGKIYRINASALTDENIISSENGDAAQYGVNVTVTEASWTVETITAEWAH